MILRKDSRQAELDYLRGLACLMVIAFHYLSRGPRAGWTGGAQFPLLEPFASYGYFGVHLFFMISGYVIFKSALGRSARDFGIGRFWRLYPAYWVAILVTTLAVKGFGATGFFVSLKDFWWNFSMLQNFAHARSVDGAYWSLQVELVFYAFVAVAIKLGLLRRPLTLIVPWLVISAANLLFRSYTLDAFALAAWGPYFSMGILAFLYREGDRRRVILFTATAAVTIAFVRIYLDSDLSGAWAKLSESFFITALMLFFPAVVAFPRNLKTTAASRQFGNLSYPVYLIHQNLGYILIAMFATHFAPPVAASLALLLVLSLGLAIHQLIELRLTNFLRFKLRH